VSDLPIGQIPYLLTSPLDAGPSQLHLLIGGISFLVEIVDNLIENN